MKGKLFRCVSSGVDGTQLGVLNSSQADIDGCESLREVPSDSTGTMGTTVVFASSWVSESSASPGNVDISDGSVVEDSPRGEFVTTFSNNTELSPVCVQSVSERCACCMSSCAWGTRLSVNGEE